MGFSEQNFKQVGQPSGSPVRLSQGYRQSPSYKSPPYRSETRNSLYIKPDPMRQQVMGSYPNGAPPCKIYHPGHSASQSAPLQNNDWVLEFEMTGHRWKDPLTGHDATDDPFEQIHLVFPDRQSAVYYARRQGLECRVFPNIDDD